MYAHNRVTGELDIVAMPGVAERELMRGPTDKLIFEWEDPESEEGRDGVWFENDGEFDAYMKAPGEKTSREPRGIEQGFFREREKEKYASQGTSRPQLATAKIYHWKGFGQTYDPVGQMFINFRKEPDSAPVFTPEVRTARHSAARRVRELQVQYWRKKAPRGCCKRSLQEVGKR